MRSKSKKLRSSALSSVKKKQAAVQQTQNKRLCNGHRKNEVFEVLVAYAKQIKEAAKQRTFEPGEKKQAAAKQTSQ